MNGQPDKTKKKYARLEQLSTEELYKLLRADIESPKNDNDEAIFYILEVIEKREKANPTGVLADVDKAWAEFNTHYNIPEGDGLSLYLIEDEFNCKQDEKPLNRFKLQWKRRPIFRLAIAAAFICIMAMSTVPAFGHSSIFQMIGQWTAEQFGFSGTPGTFSGDDLIKGTHDENYSSLQEALSDYGIEEKVIPQHIPDGFNAEHLWIQEYPEQGEVEFSLPFSDGQDYIVITIIRRSEQGNKTYEKNDEFVTSYIAGNLEHYILHNNQNIMVAWSINALECSISTTLPVSELEKMIDSIYKY